RLKFKNMIKNIQKFGFNIYGDSIGKMWIELVEAVLTNGEKSYDEKRERVALMNVRVKSKFQNFDDKIIDRFADLEKTKAMINFVFSNEIIEGFSILRRFRHYVFHGYSFRLEWDRLLLAIDSLPVLFQTFKSNIFSYKKKLSEEITD
ncbi:MAG: hypothetical protein WCT77_04470, partial [Bacteroidota bacterium]